MKIKVENSKLKISLKKQYIKMDKKTKFGVTETEN